MAAITITNLFEKIYKFLNKQMEKSPNGNRIQIKEQKEWSLLNVWPENVLSSINFIVFISAAGWKGVIWEEEHLARGWIWLDLLWNSSIDWKPECRELLLKRRNDQGNVWKVVLKVFVRNSNSEEADEQNICVLEFPWTVSFIYE